MSPACTVSVLCCVVRMEVMSPACTVSVLCCQDGGDVTCLYCRCVVLSGWR